MCQAIEEMRQESKNEGIELTRLESIRNLMVSLKCTAQQAMNYLMIPASDQSKYLAKLK